MTHDVNHPEDKLQEFVAPAGVVFQRMGIPFMLKEDAVMLTHHNNYQLMEQLAKESSRPTMADSFEIPPGNIPDSSGAADG